MTQSANGHTVKVHYTGTFDDGTQFDSSIGGEPLEVTLGQGQVIPGFEKALEDMAEGDTKTINILAEDAYGEYRQELVQEVGRENFPPEIELAVGIQLQAQGPEGDAYLLTVIKLDDDKATLDGNHPMAGKALNFALEMIEVNLEG